MSTTSRQKTSVLRSNKSKPSSYKISTRATNRNTMSETENKTTKSPVSNASEAGSSSSQKNLLKLFCSNHKLMIRSMRRRKI